MSFEHRRQQLIDLVSGSGLVIVAGSPDAENFHQNADFMMLTGFVEPDSWLVIQPGHSEPVALFARPRDAERELWDGRRLGPEAAAEAVGADVGYDVNHLESTLLERLDDVKTIWVDPSTRAGKIAQTLLERGAAMNRMGGRGPIAIRDLRPALWDIKRFKTDTEIEGLRQACRVTVEGHLAGMRAAKPGVRESEIQAAIENVFIASGARRGFETIVGSGDNGCILHYRDNASVVEDGQLVLVDAGAQLNGLCGDVTHTFPASGRFTGAQADVYDIVLATNRAVTDAAGPGTSMGELIAIARRTVIAGLGDLGLLPTDAETAYAMWHDFLHFPHGLGHPLGYDVHDNALDRVDGDWAPMEAGNVFTNEPGLYFPLNREFVEYPMLEVDLEARWKRRMSLGLAAAREIEKSEEAEAETRRVEIPAELRGIGIRIEDDLLITSDGVEVLTGGLPRSREEIEAFGS